MSSRSRTSAAAVLLTALGASLAGCSDLYLDRRETIALHAGDAVAANRVTQMVDPWSRASGNRNIGFDGQRMQGAVERHRTHQILRPASPMTTDAAVLAAPNATEAIPGANGGGQSSSGSAGKP